MEHPNPSDLPMATLAALCDTLVPRIERENDPTGFWARTATDLGVDRAVAGFIQTADEAVRAGALQLLTGLSAAGLDQAPPEAREAIVQAVAGSSPEAAAGIAQLAAVTMLFNYGLVDSMGRNPNWEILGYPGPLAPPPQTSKTITPLVPEGGDVTIEADVVIVGSGAGGGVLAGELTRLGKSVVVLEAGGYFNEADFNQVELWAYQNLYYRGGQARTVDGNIGLMAGECLGGGTTVNWANCVRTPTWVRDEWATQFGLEGLDTTRFDEHMDAVMERISGSNQTSVLNPAHERLAAGAVSLGYRFRLADRNGDPRTFQADNAGYSGFGDQSGSKQATYKNYLQDAFDGGARILVRCHGDRILIERNRAAGVAATYTDPAGNRSAVTVRAPIVIAACGPLETPALLLRSGIGGHAVGQNLTIHFANFAFGRYQDDMKAWWGPTQAAVSDEFANLTDGYGFLMELPHYSPAQFCANYPWTSGLAHKSRVASVRNLAFFLAVIRGRGTGSVGVDDEGKAVHFFQVTDEVDIGHWQRSFAELARVHEAAGAEEIGTLVPGVRSWNRGDDLDAAIQAWQSVPVDGRVQPLATAHMMSSARMGKRRSTSVADPWGQLYDCSGVWIGDCSAFPTASGANPMLTCMALARRTAHAIASG